jgi:hypothetical protein
MRLAIGDIHGKPYWKDFLDEDFAEFYFLGDYFDSYGLSFDEEYTNFAQIVAAARADSRIRLCLGNHDYHYLKRIPAHERYSRFQAHHYLMIQKVLEESMDLFNVVYLTPDNFLITHAGVSSTFVGLMKDAGVDSLADFNDAFINDRFLFAFNGWNASGNDVTQGPLWIRPAALEQDALPGYTHIVGHTPQERVVESLAEDKVTRCVYIDTGNARSVYRF